MAVGWSRSITCSINKYVFLNILLLARVVINQTYVYTYHNEKKCIKVLFERFLFIENLCSVVQFINKNLE